MASFLQNTPIQFNPYIPQQNVELYSQIGRMKQGQYDEGVQRAQGYIDSVAGLPIMKDADKQYLNQKLGEVKSKANELAGSDFSDQRNVGQIQALAAGVYNDSNVLNAVSSTQKVKGQMAILDAAKKEGKSGSANEWDLQRQVNDYLSDGKVGTTFNGAYAPYRDVRKKALDILKDITKDSSITDDAFKMDSEGNLTLSDAIVRTKLSGMSPQKIKGALASGLDADDMRQLSIEGDYSFSNHTPEDLQNIIAAAHKEDSDILIGKRTVLAAKLDGIKDGAEKEKLSSQISDIDKEIDSVSQDNKSYSNLIQSGNLRQARANYYTTKFFRNFANSFSYTDTSQTYENNPMAQMAMERNKQAQQASEWKQKFEQDAYQFGMTYEQHERKAKQDKEAIEGAYGRVDEAIDQSKLPDVNFGMLITKTDEISNTISTKDREFLASQGKTGDNAWLNNQRLQYETSRSSVTPSIKDYFDNRQQNEKALQTNQQLIVRVGELADAKFGGVDAIIDKNDTGVRFNLLNTTYNYSPAEVLTFKHKLDNLSEGIGPKTVLDNLSALKNNPEKLNKFSSKEKILLDQYTKIYSKSGFGSGQTVNPIESQVFNTINNYSAKSKQYGEQLAARNNFVNTELFKATEESQRASNELDVGKGEQRASVKSMVQAFTDRAATTKGLGDGVDVGDLIKYNNDKEATYRLIGKSATPFSDPKYWISVTTKGGQQRFEISQQEKRNVFGNKFEDTTQDKFAGIRQTINMTGGSSTNFRGTNDPVKSAATAYFRSNEFPRMENLTVKGDVYKQNGKYGLVLYVLNPLSKQMQRVEYAPPSGLMDENQLLQTISGLNDSTVWELTTSKKLDPQTLQQIQAENKKAI